MTVIGRTLALDVGDVRIGVAVSDPLGIMAQPREVVRRTALAQDIEAIRSIVEATEARRIVIGLPLNLEGKRGPQAEKVLAFVEALRSVVAAEIITQDERFSTAEAERVLINADVSRKDRKKVVDKMAAHFILQTYLDRQARQRETPPA